MDDPDQPDAWSQLGKRSQSVRLCQLAQARRRTSGGWVGAGRQRHTQAALPPERDQTLTSSARGCLAERLFRAIGRPELHDDPRFRTNADRLAHRDEIEAIVAEFIAARTQADALAFFEAAEVTVGPVNDEADLAEDPYVAEREVLVEVPDEAAGSLPMHNVIPRFSATPGALRRPAPALGEHNYELLRELGCPDEEIAGLIEAGALGA